MNRGCRGRNSWYDEFLVADLINGWPGTTPVYADYKNISQSNDVDEPVGKTWTIDDESVDKSTFDKHLERFDMISVVREVAKLAERE